MRKETNSKNIVMDDRVLREPRLGVGPNENFKQQIQRMHFDVTITAYLTEINEDMVKI
jgi:hypothetical protein